MRPGLMWQVSQLRSESHSLKQTPSVGTHGSLAERGTMVDKLADCPHCLVTNGLLTGSALSSSLMCPGYLRSLHTQVGPRCDQWHPRDRSAAAGQPLTSGWCNVTLWGYKRRADTGGASAHYIILVRWDLGEQWAHHCHDTSHVTLCDAATNELVSTLSTCSVFRQISLALEAMWPSHRVTITSWAAEHAGITVREIRASVGKASNGSRVIKSSISEYDMIWLPSFTILSWNQF